MIYVDIENNVQPIMNKANKMTNKNPRMAVMLKKNPNIIIPDINVI